MDCRLGATLGGAFLFATTIGPGHTQPVCDPALSAHAVVDDANSDQPAFMGLTGAGNLLEVRLSGEGAWTIVLTRKDGSSCAVAAGAFWETVAPAPTPLVDRHRSP